MNPRSDYVPLRKKTEDAHAAATKFQAELDRLTGQVEQLTKLVMAVVQSERRVVRGKDGSPEHVEIVSPDGELLHRRQIRREGGRIMGSK